MSSTKWALVPVVPTNEMLGSAGTIENYDVDAGGKSDEDHSAWWQLMISLAPTPPDKAVRVVTEDDANRLLVAFYGFRGSRDGQERMLAALRATFADGVVGA